MKTLNVIKAALVSLSALPLVAALAQQATPAPTSPSTQPVVTQKAPVSAKKVSKRKHNHLQSKNKAKVSSEKKQ